MNQRKRTKEISQNLEMIAQLGSAIKMAISFDEILMEDETRDTLTRLKELGIVRSSVYQRYGTDWVRYHLTAHGEHVYQSTIEHAAPYFKI